MQAPDLLPIHERLQCHLFDSRGKLSNALSLSAYDVACDSLWQSEEVVLYLSRSNFVCVETRRVLCGRPEE